MNLAEKFPNLTSEQIKNMEAFGTTGKTELGDDELDNVAGGKAVYTHTNGVVYTCENPNITPDQLLYYLKQSLFYSECIHQVPPGGGGCFACGSLTIGDV